MSNIARRGRLPRLLDLRCCSTKQHDRKGLQGHAGADFTGLDVVDRYILLALAGTNKGLLRNANGHPFAITRRLICTATSASGLWLRRW